MKPEPEATRNAGSGSRHLTAFLLTLFLAPSPSMSAQRLSGRLLDTETDEPIAAGIVTLLAGDSSALVIAVTDNDGGWSLQADTAGFYFVEVKRLGYRASIVGPLELEYDAALNGVFRLERLPVRLEPISVSAEAVYRTLDKVGFYRRQVANRGYFLDRADIERWLPGSGGNFAMVLRGLPGVTLVESAAGAGGAGMRLHRGFFSIQGCSGPRIYVDGFLRSEQGSRLDLDPSSVAGVEVYRTPSQIPVEYGGPNSGCGVILVWTLVG